MLSVTVLETDCAALPSAFVIRLYIALLQPAAKPKTPGQTMQPANTNTGLYKAKESTLSAAQLDMVCC